MAQTVYIAIIKALIIFSNISAVIVENNRTAAFGGLSFFWHFQKFIGIGGTRVSLRKPLSTALLFFC